MQPPSDQSQTPSNRPDNALNRPRPFALPSSGASNPNFRPPSRGSATRGRGIRPVRPPSQGGDPAPQPNRPRPFANRSAVFNKPAEGTADPNGATSTSISTPGPSNFTPGPNFAAPSSSFGGAAPGPSAFSSATSLAFGANNTFNPAGQAFQRPHSSSSFRPPSSSASSSAFGQPSNPPSFTPSANKLASSPAFSAFVTPASTPGNQTPGSEPLPSAFSSDAAASPEPAPSGPATTSLSSFLRKDKGPSSSTPASGASTPNLAFGSSAAKQGDLIDEDEERKRRFEDMPKAGNRFLQMKTQRDALRASYIASGVLPDPNKPTDLADAIKLIGTCQDMCPEFEREEREFQKELDRFEVYPGTSRVDPSIAVKIYRRPAAGRELPLPEDVRPPPVLKRTLDYLFHTLLPASPRDPLFTAVQPFLWNRTRAIRQDFIVQSESGPITIECHERIARYHILCLHWKGGPGAEGWSEQQELEQLRKTLRSLIEFYDDRRRSGQSSPNEAEFRAYNLLLHLRDPETLREVELLPRPIFTAPQVQTALKLHAMAQRSNNIERRGQPRNTESTLNFFSRFFSELRKPHVTYLMACLAENSFSSIRIGAIKAMSKAYMDQHRALPIEFVIRGLGLDDAQQTIDLAQHLGIELEWEDVNGHRQPVGVKVSKSTVLSEDKPLPSPFNATLVEAKRGIYTNQDVVDGVESGSAAPLPLPLPLPAKTATAPSLQGSSAFGKGQASSFAQQQQKPPSPTPFGTSTALGKTTTTPASSAGPTGFGLPSTSKLSAAAQPFVPPTAFGPTSASTTNSKVSAFSATQSASPFAASTPPLSAATASSTGPLGPKATTPSFSFGAGDAKTEPAKPAESSSFGPTAPKAEKRKPLPSAAEAVPAINPFKKIEPVPQPKAAPSKSVSFEPTPAVPSEEDKAAALAAKRKAKIAAAKPRVAERAFDTLFGEVLKTVPRQVAEAAVREEEHRRRELGREELLNSLAARLADELIEQRNHKAAKRVAQEAVAVAVAERWYKRFALDSWKLAMTERRDRQEQARRLEEIRQELRRRGKLDRDTSRASLRSSLLTGQRRPAEHRDARPRSRTRGTAESTDSSLRKSFAQTRRKRSDLWEEDTFLAKLVEQLDDLFVHFCPAEMQHFSALYCGAAGDHVASGWLRAKFGLGEGAETQVELTDGSTVSVIDSASVSDVGEEVGLVVFECDPRLVHAKDEAERTRLIAQDQERLRRVSESAAVTDSVYACRLLVVSWTTSASVEVGAMHAWDGMGMLSLGNASVDAEAELGAVLGTLLANVSWNARHHRTTLSELIDPLYAVLTDAVHRICAVGGAGIKALRVLTALANHVLRTVLSVSETIVEEEEEGSLLLHVPEGETSLVDAAIKQLGGEADVALLRSEVLAAPTLPLERYVHALLAIARDRLALVWVDAQPLPSGALRTLEHLVAAAEAEIAHDARTQRSMKRPVDESPARSRSRSRSRSPPLKRTRAAELQSQPQSTGALGELRALMERTRQLLAEG